MRIVITTALASALAELGIDSPDEIHLEQPARRDHGDFSSNIALTSAKKAGTSPRELAQQLVDSLNQNLPPHVTSVEIAGPGFVNFRLDDAWLQELIPQVLAAGDSYGRSQTGQGQKVLIEFVSSNPTGPVHAGHARGAVFGDSLGRLLSYTGYQVEREFYINDRGVQMRTFAASLTARKVGSELPDGGYNGQYIKDWAEQMPKDADPLEWGERRALDDARTVLERLNVHHRLEAPHHLLQRRKIFPGTLRHLHVQYHGLVAASKLGTNSSKGNIQFIMQSNNVFWLN